MVAFESSHTSEKDIPNLPALDETTVKNFLESNLQVLAGTDKEMIRTTRVKIENYATRIAEKKDNSLSRTFALSMVGFVESHQGSGIDKKFAQDMVYKVTVGEYATLINTTDTKDDKEEMRALVKAGKMETESKQLELTSLQEGIQKELQQLPQTEQVEKEQKA